MISWVVLQTAQDEIEAVQRRLDIVIAQSWFLSKMVINIDRVTYRTIDIWLEALEEDNDNV